MARGSGFPTSSGTACFIKSSMTMAFPRVRHPPAVRRRVAAGRFSRWPAFTMPPATWPRWLRRFARRRRISRPMLWPSRWRTRLRSLAPCSFAVNAMTPAHCWRKHRWCCARSTTRRKPDRAMSSANWCRLRMASQVLNSWKPPPAPSSPGLRPAPPRRLRRSPPPWSMPPPDGCVSSGRQPIPMPIRWFSPCSIAAPPHWAKWCGRCAAKPAT